MKRTDITLLMGCFAAFASAFTTGCATAAASREETDLHSAHGTAGVAPTDQPRLVFMILTEPERDPLDAASVVSERLQHRGFEVRRPVRQRQERSRAPKGGSCYGSGFFISADGVFITNNHVVDEAESILLRLTTGETVEAVVIAADKKNDVALLRPKESKHLSKWLRLAKFTQSSVGEDIRVIGYPDPTILGKKARVTAGVISADAGTHDDPTRFQISAPIQPGNSGGPIVNKNCEVLGIATSSLGDLYAFEKTGSLPQNVNFGVKIDYSRLLFDKSVDASVEAERSSASTLEDVVESTALVMVNIPSVPEGPVRRAASPTRKIVGIQYSYTYLLGLVQQSVPTFKMQWVDLESGEIMASASRSGRLFTSASSTAASLIEELLEKTKSRPGIQESRVLLASAEPEVIIRGLKQLRLLNAPDVVPDILPFLKHPHPNVVRDACRTLAVLGNAETIPYIEPLLNHKRADVRKDAQHAIAALRSKPRMQP